MNMAAYNPFGGMTSGDQSFGARRPFLLDGDYNVEIERCLMKGRQDPWFVIEVTVLESNVPERPAGAQCSIFIDAGNQDTRGKHICAFIASAMGYDPLTLPKDSPVAPWDGQPWSGYAAWSLSEQNPFGKKRMFVNVQSIWTQAKSAFSLHTFGAYGQKPIGPRILGPAYGQGGQPQGPGNAGAPTGAAPGFQQPVPQPGVAPPGFQGGGQPPLGGFAPPGAQPPAGPPPAGWGQQPSFPAGAPQPGPQPQQQYPQQQAPQTGYQQPPYQQPSQQQPQYQPPQQQPQYQPPQQQQYPQQQPQPQGGFGGPWGGQQR